jgi:hypothetical protein
MIVFEEYCLCECCAQECRTVRAGRKVLCRVCGCVLNEVLRYD